SVFVTGSGFDSQSDFHRLFDRGVDTLGNPLPFDAVYGLGQGVSYGYAAPGKTLVPIFGGSFSFGAIGARSCAHDDVGCLAGKLVRFERWVSVGEGDVASARAPLEKAKGTTLGRVEGVVLRQADGTPSSGKRVFALRDPRDLTCDEACEKRCGAAPGPGAIDGVAAAKVIEANRCRTEDDTFLQGHAAIESMALTDLGERPSQDGQFSMDLPPGRYVLVAVDGPESQSKTAMVTVVAGKTARASLLLPKVGTLAYAVFDEAGNPSPARVTVGRCWARSSCVEDGDCGGDLVCQEGACSCEREPLLALELGGGRFADGVVAYDVTRSGNGSIDLPPGDYEVLISRGPHRDIDRSAVTIESGTTTR
ncbi:MAG: hypothetical protein KC416_17320, partial [Myxococcales bacterium]|nr:hypothetical protein [Myxococcales bacterium]